MPQNKTIRVACAIIIDNKKVLVTQRSNTMLLPLKWEFPGGKVNSDETDEECLHRELWEELKIIVKIKCCLKPTSYDYGSFAIDLVPFVVNYVGGNITLVEHEAAEWFNKDDLTKLDWAPADVPLVNDLISSSFLDPS